MQRIKIQNFGPIKECDINIDRMIVFIGSQSQGKSTIA